MPVSVSITNEQKVKIAATPVTATGRPAPVEGPIRISIVSGDSTITQDALEPMAFYAVSSDTPGDTTYLVEADADLGAGEVLIQDTVTLSVVGALASNLGLSVGLAEPK